MQRRAGFARGGGTGAPRALGSWPSLQLRQAVRASRVEPARALRPRGQALPRAAPLRPASPPAPPLSSAPLRPRCVRASLYLVSRPCVPFRVFL